MDKRKIAIGLKPTADVKFQDKIISVKPYISQEVQYNLAQEYISIMFADNDFVKNYYSAEWYVILNIVDQCTDLMVIEKDEKDNIDIDTLVSSGLWYDIKNKIENYNEFREFLKEMCQSVKEERALEKSFGQALDKITNKVIEFIDKIGNVDLSQEGVANLVSGLNSQVEKFKTDFPTSVATAPTKAKRQYKKKEK
jgi:hypothetical protein